MENTMAVNEFSLKFQKLSEQNQKYILAIEQAMLYAQDSEISVKKDIRKKEEDKKDELRRRKKEPDKKTDYVY